MPPVFYSLTHSRKNTILRVWNNKQIWKSLKTKVLSVAQARLADELKTHRGAVKIVEAVENGKATIGQLSTVYLESEAPKSGHQT